MHKGFYTGFGVLGFGPKLGLTASGNYDVTKRLGVFWLEALCFESFVGTCIYVYIHTYTQNTNRQIKT